MAGFPKAGDEYGGRYRIVRELGHGGMGSVYEAVDQVLNRSVALKIVLPSLPDRDTYQERFAREATVLARIRSRHIVGIHEYGEHEDTVFFVTELFPDGDLQTWLAKNGPLERRPALLLVAQVCEALADAHAAGVIHRDVKPGNVLLWSRSEGLIPYLCDFGIAIDEGKKGLTRTGTLVGSPAYMAPERHFGHAADERGDIYSVGCLLWSVLAGDAPYSGTDFQMMNSHINEPTPKLGTGHPVDDQIDELLADALQKDPDRRVATAAEMRERLLAIVAGIDGVGTATPTTPPPPAAVRPDAAPAPDEGTRMSATPTAAAAAAAASSAPQDEPEEPAKPARPRKERRSRKDRPAALAPSGIDPAPEEDRPEAPAPVVPVSGPSTIIRNLPLPPHAPDPEPAPDEKHPHPSRRRAGLIGAAVLLLLVVGGTAVALGGGDDEPTADPTPGSTSSTSPSSEPSTTAEPLARPGAPTLEAEAAYRSVRFTVTAPKPAQGVDQVVELREGNGWTKAGDRITVATEQGGDKGCVVARTVARAGGEQATSKPVRACGTAQPRTVQFIRTSDPCVNSVGGPCTWYDVRVTGFAGPATPLVTIQRAGGGAWCPGGCDWDAIRIGADGRGYLRHDWKISRDEGIAVVTVDGASTRLRVYH